MERDALRLGIGDERVRLREIIDIRLREDGIHVRRVFGADAVVLRGERLAIQRIAHERAVPHRHPDLEATGRGEVPQRLGRGWRSSANHDRHGVLQAGLILQNCANPIGSARRGCEQASVDAAAARCPAHRNGGAVAVSQIRPCCKAQALAYLDRYRARRDRQPLVPGTPYIRFQQILTAIWSTGYQEKEGTEHGHPDGPAGPWIARWADPMAHTTSR